MHLFRRCQAICRHLPGQTNLNPNTGRTLHAAPKSNSFAMRHLRILFGSGCFNCFYESGFLPGEFTTIRQSGRKPFGTANHGLADGSGKGSKHAAKNPLMKGIKGIPIEYASKPSGQKAGTLFEFDSAVSPGCYSKFKQCLSRQFHFSQ